MKLIWFIIAIQVLLTVIAIVIIGYLIFRRIKLWSPATYSQLWFPGFIFLIRIYFL